MSNQPHTINRPEQVVMAVRLIWLNIAISILDISVNWNDMIALSSQKVTSDVLLNIPNLIPTIALITVSLSVAISAWMAIKISAGRNWARILYTILTVVGILLGAPDLAEYLQFSRLIVIFYAVNTLISILVIALLFTRPARTWYSAVKASKSKD